MGCEVLADATMWIVKLANAGVVEQFAGRLGSRGTVLGEGVGPDDQQPEVGLGEVLDQGSASLTGCAQAVGSRRCEDSNRADVPEFSVEVLAEGLQ